MTLLSALDRVVALPLFGNREKSRGGEGSTGASCERLGTCSRMSRQSLSTGSAVFSGRLSASTVDVADVAGLGVSSA
jgi:hypothetical protein